MSTTTFELIREDPNVMESLRAIAFLLTGGASYQVELEEKWIGHLREGKLSVRTQRWLSRDLKHWQEDCDMTIVIHAILRIDQCFEIRNLRYDTELDSEVAVFKFEVVT